MKFKTNIYRVVIKNLHASTDIEYIEISLEILDHGV